MPLQLSSWLRAGCFCSQRVHNLVHKHLSMRSRVFTLVPIRVSKRNLICLFQICSSIGFIYERTNPNGNKPLHAPHAKSQKKIRRNHCKSPKIPQILPSFESQIPENLEKKFQNSKKNCRNFLFPKIFVRFFKGNLPIGRNLSFNKIVCWLVGLKVSGVIKNTKIKLLK